MISAMNINPAVLDQAVGLLDLIALVRDPGASKAMLEDFVKQRKVAEAALKDANAKKAEIDKAFDELTEWRRKGVSEHEAVNASREACAREQQKLSDARDDVERGREEIKQHQISVEQARSAMASEREAVVKQRASMAADFAQQREQIHAEQVALDVRAAEVEAKDAVLTERLAKLRALAGE